MTEKMIRDAYCKIRTIDQTIPDDVLDFMRDASIEKLNCLPSSDVKVSELDGLPENKPLYKDSGLWQLRSDDMKDVIVQQRVNESNNDFLLRCKA